MNIVKRLLTQKENRILGSNIFSLGFLNMINYIFPLLIIPHLTRTLGSENYGLYAYATVIVGYFALVVQYGFDFSATREIAQVRESPEKIRKIFWRITFARLWLFLGCSIVLTILLLLIPAMRKHVLLYFSGLLLLLEIVVMPTWFFQGMETMKIITLLNFLMKGGAFISIIMLVREKDQYSWAFFLYCSSFLAGGILGFLFACWRFSLYPVLVPLWEVQRTLWEGWHVFIACVGTRLYREANVIILGIVANYQAVGYYFTATKLIGAIQSFCGMPIMQGIYPYMSRKLNARGRQQEGNILYMKIGIAYAVFMLLVMIVFLIFSKILLFWYLGDCFNSTETCVWIISPVILIGNLNYYGGIVGLINLGAQKSFAKFVWQSGIISIICCFLLSPSLEEQGAAWAMVLGEAFLFALTVHKLHILLGKNRSFSA